MAGYGLPTRCHLRRHRDQFCDLSEVAERVELCLFDGGGAETRLDLPEVDGYVWHGYMPGVGPGQRYGYRVYGPYAPELGSTW